MVPLRVINFSLRISIYLVDLSSIFNKHRPKFRNKRNPKISRLEESSHRSHNRNHTAHEHQLVESHRDHLVQFSN